MTVTPRFIIYALVDPRTDAVRYIGKSSSGLARPRAHGEPAVVARDPNRHKARWIAGLMAAGLSYRVDVLEEVDAASDLNEAERAWIAQGRRLGWRLTNITAGGDGGHGVSPSAETRAKLSRAAKGRTLTAEHREKVRAAKLGQKRAPFSEEWRANLSAAQAKRRHPPETRAKMSAALAGNQRGKANRGRVFSAETIERMRESQRARRVREALEAA